MLELYRRAIALRRSHVPAEESLSWLDLGAGVLAFRRASDLVCVTTFGIDPVPLPAGEVLIATAPVIDGLLPGEATAWLLGR